MPELKIMWKTESYGHEWASSMFTRLRYNNDTNVLLLSVLHANNKLEIYCYSNNSKDHIDALFKTWQELFPSFTILGRKSEITDDSEITHFKLLYV